jgi:hypothetical protein
MIRPGSKIAAKHEAAESNARRAHMHAFRHPSTYDENQKRCLIFTPHILGTPTIPSAELVVSTMFSLSLK